MGKDEQTSFIDDAFDDKKAQEEIERLKGSNRLGCIAIVIVVLVVGLCLFGGIGLLGALGAR